MVALSHALITFAGLSPHIDIGCIYERIKRKYGDLSMREAEVLVRGWTQGYLAGRPNVSIADRKRNLPRPPE
jgi:hypothetical protein